MFNSHQTEQPTMGEFMQKSKINGIKSVVVGVLVAMLLIGVVYTGVHNFNLFARSLGADQQLFAIVPVLLIEGGVLLMLAGSFVWFSGGSQKLIAQIIGWALFGVIAANTLIDSLTNAGEALPSWLHIYATFIMFATPVIVMAMLKLILDLDPAKRKLDMQKTIEHSLDEAKHAATHRALMSESNRDALNAYAEQIAEAMARHIRNSAPQTEDAPTVTTPRPRPPSSGWTRAGLGMAKDAPAAHLGSDDFDGMSADELRDALRKAKANGGHPAAGGIPKA